MKIQWFTKRDVHTVQAVFRRMHLNQSYDVRLCRCGDHVEPHLHAPLRARRLGHLPMIAIKECPE